MITQAKFFNAARENVQSIINGTPVIGHAKAMAQYAMGNPVEANKALKAASRSTGVLFGATLGTVIGGPSRSSYRWNSWRYLYRWNHNLN